MIPLDRHRRTCTRSLHRFGLLSMPAVLAVITACSQSPKPSPEPAPEPARRRADDTQSASGATQSLDAKELKTDRVQSVEELIQGRFAGVQVVRLPGGGFSLRIRGAGSFTGGNEPLYVVDGVALPPAPGGALIGVDPRDIERIEVLKDAAATSSYGVRGANGVILIRTKRGR
jgi:TonB-dependent SusC/RagA subfamily outer membrane receptor